jgi:hypothetical protein
LESAAFSDPAKSTTKMRPSSASLKTVFSTRIELAIKKYFLKDALD